MKQSYPFYRINAFTSHHFSGNPASVVVLKQELPHVAMYTAIAAEMSTPETVFVLPLTQLYSDGHVFSLRFFMATHEVKMCGHATLAAAHVLLKEGKNQQNSTLLFKTLSGTITANLLPIGKIALDFPSDTFVDFTPSDELLQKMGLTNLVKAVYAESRNLAIFQVENLSTLQGIQPDFDALKKHKELAIKKVAITTNVLDSALVTTNPHQLAQNYDFVSRCFCPWIGIDEDALSAASHTLLASFWAMTSPKRHFKAFQASKRTGELEIIIKNDQRMELVGDGYVSLKGEIYY